MNTPQTVAANHRSPAQPRPPLGLRATRDGTLPVTRTTADGHFSIVDFGTLVLDAEPGLVIRVHAGCMWVPQHREHCSVGVGPGEHFVVPSAGPLTVLATARTHVELAWPSLADARPLGRRRS